MHLRVRRTVFSLLVAGASRLRARRRAVRALGPPLAALQAAARPRRSPCPSALGRHPLTVATTSPVPKTAELCTYSKCSAASNQLRPVAYAGPAPRCARREVRHQSGTLAAMASRPHPMHLWPSLAVQPNPSLKRSANGRPPGPATGYGVHFPVAGPGVLPSSPA